MLVICTHCAAKIKIVDTAFDRGIPTVICPVCDEKFKPDVQKEIKREQPLSSDKEGDTKVFAPTDEAGWLIVHDIRTKQQTLTLKPGRQTIGRISSIATKKADLMIDTEDEYMSRKHFFISVEGKSSGAYNYYLSDNSSRNRTLINKKVLRQGDEYILTDGDIIQAGLTNIVFKANNRATSRGAAQQAVAVMPKEKTEAVFDF